jgi:methionyl-tRNA formyltransferase
MSRVVKRLKVLTTALGDATALPPGVIDRSRNRLDVACGDGRLLTLLTVQPEGRPTMSGAAFLQGRRTLRSFE